MRLNRGMPIALVGIVALAAGLLLGLTGRILLRSRVRLSWPTATLIGIIGATIGGIISALDRGATTTTHVIISFVAAVAATVVLMLLTERFERRRQVPRGSVADLIGAGESSHIEFKSSARYNFHSQARDERIEQVIVKTVAGFLNAEGGCLLVGVNDEGKAIGLAEDFQLMKVADRDRYELFLRDILSKAMGSAITATVVVEFDKVEGNDVCLLRIPPATRPIFVVLGKEGAKQFIVRVGNSTRSLEIDEALAYCSRRWGARSLRQGVR
jgi:uncharacterized membrane protein YeaQ/YmgE (transglycosylase-associated protein family)